MNGIFDLRFAIFGWQNIKIETGTSEIETVAWISLRGADAGQQQMQMMRRMQRGGAQPAVTVSAQVRAEWSLAEGEGEAWLVAAHELQEEVRAAFTPAAGSMTPEEQELMEEMMMFGRGMGMGTEDGGGPVSFLFVKKISGIVNEPAETRGVGVIPTSSSRALPCLGSMIRSPGADPGRAVRP